MAYDWPVRRAHLDDVKEMHSLLLDCAQKGLLLPRALSFLFEHVRNFWVIDAPDGRLAACCALAPVWDDLAEICSLVVREDFRRNGLGRKVVEACLSDCESLRVKRVFSLTYQVEFFKTLGFGVIEKGDLPQKIWSSCVHCPKYPDRCDETAVFRLVEGERQ